MCKLARVIRYTVSLLSQNFHFFAVLERWLVYDCETAQFCLFIVLVACIEILVAECHCEKAASYRVVT